MISRTHDVGAVALLLTMVICCPPEPMSIATILVAMIASIIGALLPDIDQASNRLWDLLPGGNLVGRVFKNLFLSHRTLSHSLLGLWLIYQATVWLVPRLFNINFVDSEKIIFALLIGFVSHLILDLLTTEGIPLLFPLKWKFGFPPIKKLRIRTGNWVEKWIVFPIIVGGVLWLGASNWQKIGLLIKMS